MSRKIGIVLILVFSYFLSGCGVKSTANETPEMPTNPSSKVVIGYIPTWVDMRKTIDETDLGILTHINLSFFNPDATGAFLSADEPLCSDGLTSDILYVVEKAHQKGVKVLASVGGGVLPECSGDWELLLKESLRPDVVKNILSLIDFYNLDGIDIDIEGGLLNTISEAGDYTPFIQDLHLALHPKGKLVTCATASYVGGRIPVSSIPYFDYINVMAYDNHWKTSENHSTYKDAVRDMELWLGLGCPPNKLVLGLPFYGYQNTVGSGGVSYKDIIALNPGNAEVDEYENYKYNGLATIGAKTAYAVKHGAGVMIWEISQDGSGDQSLLQAIGRHLE